MSRLLNADYRGTKMQFAMTKDANGTSVNDKTTERENGITTETMGNPKYLLELFLRVVTVSLEMMKIVNGLPGLG